MTRHTALEERWLEVGNHETPASWQTVTSQKQEIALLEDAFCFHERIYFFLLDLPLEKPRNRLIQADQL